ncbi:hypothetical protein RUM43_012198 [Polyplax serrata]|uniref:Uncharacterized protein n=1 Tax=Polyplax serrata TaxID=468196 RepID=A0AAN8P357_POLSC
MKFGVEPQRLCSLRTVDDIVAIDFVSPEATHQKRDGQAVAGISEGESDADAEEKFPNLRHDRRLNHTSDFSDNQNGPLARNDSFTRVPSDHYKW